MNVEVFNIFVLIIGICFLIFGLSVVFNNSFLNVLYRTIWRRSNLDKATFPGKTGYYYDRYVRGITSLLAGITLLAYFIYSLTN